MIYSPSTTAALGIVEDAQPEEPLTLRAGLAPGKRLIVKLSQVLPCCCRPRMPQRAISC